MQVVDRLKTLSEVAKRFRKALLGYRVPGKLPAIDEKIIDMLWDDLRRNRETHHLGINRQTERLVVNGIAIARIVWDLDDWD